MQIIAQTANSVIYAVENDSNTKLAKDSHFVLKGGTVWYKRKQALGPGKDIDESDGIIKKEATIYKTLGNHDRILKCFGSEVDVLNGQDSLPKAWALRLERSPLGSLRNTIIGTYNNPPSQLIRLQLAHQFSGGVAHLHHMEIIWGDLSTRNAFLFDNCDWYGCEDRYCPPDSDNPQLHDVGTMNRELFALASAICEIIESKLPYGSDTEVLGGDVAKQLVNGKWPDLSDDNPARAVIKKLWGYSYKSSNQVVQDLQNLLVSCE
ncbi:hypothetical protein FAUST_8043 [Fusarium austroamericanum]|uniref:Protein kinase domain-containing protein n=1 Tax=Fusarium austroamericanum TaxID=282268 RepID=A0AAN5Z683_FUSAU|nr:hypothetical protein FAUST_8043 [Fusarium austroamericanum]